MDKTATTNNDLIKLAEEVLKNYTITPQKIDIIQSGGIKTVWKIKGENNIVCLKRLKRPYDKALFSVNAQLYVSQNGGKVPTVVLNKENNPIVVHQDEVFVLYEWIEGRDLNFNNAQDLELAVKGLAEFHSASKGYQPPADSKISSKLGKQEEQYMSMKNSFLEWKEIAETKKMQSQYVSYLEHVDSIVEAANLALEQLKKSEYNHLTEENSRSVVLCHQDYGKGNAILSNIGVYVLDLDGVTFDLPSRDLRKIIGKCAENKGIWDISIINDITDWYSSVNFLSDAEKEVLYIDLLYPHWFYGLLKNLFKNNKSLNPTSIEKIAKLEQSKVPILLCLLNRG